MAPHPGSLTTGQAADRLGVGAATVRRWAKEGRVRHVVLPSGRMRFDPADLDAYLAPRGDAPAGAA